MFLRLDVFGELVFLTLGFDRDFRNIGLWQKWPQHSAQKLTNYLHLSSTEGHLQPVDGRVKYELFEAFAVIAVDVKQELNTQVSRSSENKQVSFIVFEAGSNNTTKFVFEHGHLEFDTKSHELVVCPVPFNARRGVAEGQRRFNTDYTRVDK